MAVAEHADEVDAREKDIKTVASLPPSQIPCVADVETRWPLDGNANAPRLDVDHGV